MLYFSELSIVLTYNCVRQRDMQKQDKVSEYFVLTFRARYADIHVYWDHVQSNNKTILEKIINLR